MNKDLKLITGWEDELEQAMENGAGFNEVVSILKNLLQAQAELSYRQGAEAAIEEFEKECDSPTSAEEFLLRLQSLIK